MTAQFKDHFSGGAAGYAAYRPTYPARLAAELAAISPGTALALDCACGTGQLSVLLADHFDAVVATDASAAQIAQAQPHERVRYATALAERSGLADGSVDLVTVAQAAHWFELDKFYDEVRRVARPGAVLALVTYGVQNVAGPADPVLQKFYAETLGPYWPPERRHVEEGYRNLAFPFQEVALPALAMEASWTAAELVGYVGTWSAVKEARKALDADPVPAFARELEAAWGDPEQRRRVTWPLTVRAGRIA
ncbi:ubiquinone/menaquinone biosynthesis C-methylase UbiE [Pseudoduganella lurida]|uniref:Ubiquinone/menaquinone biosynthesis C-methylase UbiE n=1 Tax=Pseudoduganella lurida TaxID=1036180 RepID=A0A562R8L4_9BURK|nr:class I SAM-dependent methyltransferase [Pseudoduganella lurida]TWI65223.1 ubiquinone/menaquinone biosynthesis C-methylase UbiE [Pseudoduganella lurida]